MEAFCALVALSVVVIAVVYFVQQGGKVKPSQLSAVSAVEMAGPPTADRLPDEIVPMMERFGRYSVQSPNEIGDDPAEIYREVIAPLYALAQMDLQRFTRALRDRVLPLGGWAVLGASRAMWELAPGERESQARTELLAAGLEFLRDRGVPNTHLKGYEWDYWLRTKGRTERWLTGKSKPTPQQAPITDLAPGELRRIVQIFPEPDSNLILVRRHAEGGYVSVVDARWSDDDPRRVLSDQKRAATLNDLYWEIGCGLQTPTHWSHPEMKPYFPLPRPRLT